MLTLLFVVAAALLRALCPLALGAASPAILDGAAVATFRTVGGGIRAAHSLMRT